MVKGTVPACTGQRAAATARIQKITTEKILECIDAGIENNCRLTIDTLSSYSGYSRRHLQRLFQDRTGMCVGEYIRRRRLTRAALLLRFSLRSYQDIALSVGYDSQQSMNREFKRQTGVTPGQYRERPEWLLAPLTGRVCPTFDIPEPEVVCLEEGCVTGEEMCFYGSVAIEPDTPSFTAHLDRIFAHTGGELWMVAQTVPAGRRDYHYQVTCVLGGPGQEGKAEGRYAAGRYLKVSFETTRETHVARTHYIYQTLLPGKGAARSPGTEVLVFLYRAGKVMCTLFIPVM
ncbi:Putatve transcriptional regulator ykgA [Escherichia coli]|uniref:helix-turn-helix domain-containing protein n=1 Tax=Escherichia coli TaxID=562 RepID=UPI001919D0BC|nr:AraC family transcriptional regulator [Escherichia coli]CAD5758049.1 Putatve transcriptional regulator ykgA [Escherichia coli]